MNDRLSKLLSDARRHLLETGTRNRLVHTPRQVKHSRSLTFTSIDADRIFELLARGGRSLRFLPAADDGAPATPAGEASIRTRLDVQQLEKRLLGLYRDAKTAEEEQGINILFLALGFLQWFEDDKSDVQREAPLVLVPVTLIRDARRATFDLRFRDDDVVTNQAIQERLRADFDIVLPDVPETDDWKPSDYVASVAEAISTKPRWSIESNGAQLGFFSFSKILMIHDLEPMSWPGEAILNHPILRGLLVDGFHEEPPVIPDDARLDALFKPADLVQIVDADSSQTVVIETVRSGRNLVVQGPPGTGKSQTIANIVAAAVHDGKKVLLVAEKMAALNVVHDRLCRAGLGNTCLELHSRSANKRKVAEELGRTLGSCAAAPTGDAEIDRLTRVRDALNEFVERLHTPIAQIELTPFEALSMQIAARENGVIAGERLVTEASRWDRAVYRSLRQAVETLAAFTREAGPRDAHPFYGVRATALQPQQRERLTSHLAEFAAKAKAFSSDGGPWFTRYLDISGHLTLATCDWLIAVFDMLARLPENAEDIFGRVCDDPASATRVAEAGLRWRELRDAHAERFNDAAWDAPALTIRAGLAAGASSFLARFGSAYRSSSTQLASLLSGAMPKKAGERAAPIAR